MKMIRLPPVAIGIGILLLVLSFIWPMMVGKAVWSNEQARELIAASAERHRLSHEHHPSATPGAEGGHEHKPGDLKAAEERYRRAEEKLQRARFFHVGAATVIKWTGILSLLGGLVGYFALARRAAA